MYDTNSVGLTLLPFYVCMREVKKKKRKALIHGEVQREKMVESLQAIFFPASYFIYGIITGDNFYLRALFFSAARAFDFFIFICRCFTKLFPTSSFR